MPILSYYREDQTAQNLILLSTLAVKTYPEFHIFTNRFLQKNNDR